MIRHQTGLSACNIVTFYCSIKLDVFESDFSVNLCGSPAIATSNCATEDSNNFQIRLVRFFLLFVHLDFSFIRFPFLPVHKLIKTKMSLSLSNYELFDSIN